MNIGYEELIRRAESEIVTIGLVEAQALHGAGDALFVDLRDRRELEREGRIPGAFHCPRGMLEFWIDPASPYHKPVFAEPRRFVFYCASGWRSALATKAAQEMGLAPVAHVGGGFSAWKSDGLPVEPVAQAGIRPR